jgi:uncharacterized protein YjbI with pentapeptide repeats
VSLRNADLRHAHFHGSTFGIVNFSGADLRSADFRHASALGPMNLEATCLRHAQFGDAVLSDSDFKLAQGLDVDLRGADLSNAKFAAPSRPTSSSSGPHAPPMDAQLADLRLDHAKLGNATLPSGWGPTGLRLSPSVKRALCRGLP